MRRARACRAAAHQGRPWRPSDAGPTGRQNRHGRIRTICPQGFHRCAGRTPSPASTGDDGCGQLVDLFRQGAGTASGATLARTSRPPRCTQRDQERRTGARRVDPDHWLRPPSDALGVTTPRSRTVRNAATCRNIGHLRVRRERGHRPRRATPSPGVSQALGTLNRPWRACPHVVHRSCRLLGHCAHCCGQSLWTTRRGRRTGPRARRADTPEVGAGPLTHPRGPGGAPRRHGGAAQGLHGGANFRPASWVLPPTEWPRTRWSRAPDPAEGSGRGSVGDDGPSPGRGRGIGDRRGRVTDLGGQPCSGSRSAGQRGGCPVDPVRWVGS